MRFEGKVAVVTGGSKGLGRDIAISLAKEGADVAVVGRSQDALDEVTHAIDALGRRTLAARLDVRQSPAVKEAVDRVAAAWGKIDILVNGAGFAYRCPLIHMNSEKINEIVDVNLKGAIYSCQHVIPHMARRKYGKIINISSTAGLHGAPNMSVYSATKWALIGLTQALAGELSHYNVNVNAVCPGAVYTPGMEEHARRVNPKADPRETYARIYEHHLFPREIMAHEVSAAVLWLASEEARNTTAHALPVSGGAERKAVPKEPYFTV